MTVLRTVEEVLNLKTGALINANELFRDQELREMELFQMRTAIETQIQLKDVEFVCLYCKQPVAIRARIDTKHFYFSHLTNSDDCHIKNARYTKEQVLCMKYNGAKESEYHFRVKNLIGNFLEKTPQVEDVKIDKVFKSERVSHTWRKPDVYAKVLDKQMAFELQLSTTFLSVIVERARFYRSNNVYLLWIFSDFSLKDDLQNCMQKDVYYNNSMNVYVFDEEARRRSSQVNMLILKCHYKEYFISENSIGDHWCTCFISIDQLKFDEDTFRVYYFDSEAQHKAVEIELDKIKREEYRQNEILELNTVINEAIQYIKEYHKCDQPPDSAIYSMPVIRRFEEVNLINSKLKFDGENIGVIVDLFFHRRKPNWLKFLSLLGYLKVDTTRLSKNGKTALEEILNIKDYYEFRDFCCGLFAFGYKLNDHDKEMLELLKWKNQNYKDLNNGDAMDRWGLVWLLNNLTHRQYAYDILKIDKTLFCLLALKTKVICGFHFNSVMQVLHTSLINRLHFTTVILRGMKSFEGMDYWLSLDKEGKLKKKIDQISQNNPKQDTSYYHIIYDIFPEMLSF